MPLYLLNIMEIKFKTGFVNAPDDFSAKAMVPGMIEEDFLVLDGGNQDIIAKELICKECNTPMIMATSMTAVCPKCEAEFSLFEEYNE